MRGTAEISRAPLSTSRSTHSEIGGRESSMNPPSIDSDGSFLRKRDRSSWNSLAPLGSLLPWPTTRSAGSPFFLPFATTPGSLKSSLLEIQQRVQRRRRDRRPSLGSAVRHRRQPAPDQALLRLRSPHEPDRKPDDEGGLDIHLQQLEERRRRVPHDPDGPGTDLLRRDPEPRRGARRAEILGDLLRPRVGDEAEGLAGRDSGGYHPHVRDYGSAASQGLEPTQENRFVQNQGVGVLEVGGGVYDALGY